MFDPPPEWALIALEHAKLALVGSSSAAEEGEETPAVAPVPSIQEELKAVREELAAFRQLFETIAKETES